jgi:ABC-type multidrug transport system permease subunit
MVDEEMEAVIIALGMYAPIMILSGIIWPLEGVNAIVLAISYSLPCTWPTEAVRAIVNRGWGFTHSKVWPGFAVLVGWTISCWILTTVVHKIRNR